MPRGMSVCQPCPRPGGSIPPLLDPILTTGLFPGHARALGTERREQDPTLLLPSVCVCLSVCARKNLGLREEETKFEFRKTRKNKLPLVISGSLFDAHSRFRFFSLLC